RGGRSPSAQSSRTPRVTSQLTPPPRPPPPPSGPPRGFTGSVGSEADPSPPRPARANTVTSSTKPTWRLWSLRHRPAMMDAVPDAVTVWAVELGRGTMRERKGTLSLGPEALAFEAADGYSHL